MKPKKSLFLAFALVMVLSLMSVTVSAENGVSYLNEAGIVCTASNSTTLSEGDVSWSGGWYVAAADGTISSRVTVTGAVNLILADGVTLNIPNGINVTDANSLTIYGQSTGANMGSITISNVEKQNAGIGSGMLESAGSITINGGNVTVIGGYGCAGIGGGQGGSAGSITINGGSVTATGGQYAAGIGGGYNSRNSYGNINIYGGTVEAIGDDRSAGIGGGRVDSVIETIGGNITISGGTITARTDSQYAAAIGSGEKGSCGTITINGGIVNAEATNDSNGYIGCGWSGTVGIVIINGGQVTAARIRNYDSNDLTISINGGQVYVSDSISGNTTLSWTNASDSIYAKKYYGTVTVANGNSFKTDDIPSSNICSGTVEKDSSTNTHPSIDGKTLTPADRLTITIDNEITLGTVTADKTVALSGETVTLTVTPDAHYRLKTLSYSVNGGTAVEVNAVNGVYSFAMPNGSVVISAEFEIYEYPFWVGGEIITADRMSDSGWSFEGDLNSGTLTLNNANLNGSYTMWGSCIGAEAPLTIVLEGANTVTGDTGIYTKGTYDSAGVLKEGNLTITGDGSLTVQGSQNGIYTQNGITISGVTVTVSGQYGINIAYDNYDLTVTDSVLTAEGTIASAQSIKVSGGKLVVSGDSVVTAANLYFAVYANAIDLTDNLFLAEPAGRTINNDHHLVDANGSDAGKVVIKEKEYPFTVELGEGHENFAQNVFGGTEGMTVSGTKITYTVPMSSTIGDAKDVFIDAYIDYISAYYTEHNAEFPLIDNGKYFMGNLARKQASSYASLSEVNSEAAQYDFQKIPEEGITYYAQWAQPVGDVTVKITPPAVGTEIKLINKGQATQRSDPGLAATVTGNAVFDTDSAADWKGSKYNDYYIGTVEANQTCYARFYLNANYGYYFPSGDDYIVDSVTVTNDSIAVVTSRIHNSATVCAAVTPEVNPVFKKQSLVLTGQIGVNFFMDLPEIDGVDYSESYMTFDVGTTVSGARADYENTFKDTATGIYYGFTCYVNAIQMADTITATYHYSDNGTECTIQKEYSVEQYLNDRQAMIVDSTNENDIAEKNLLQAINDYGYHSQIFLPD